MRPTAHRVAARLAGGLLLAALLCGCAAPGTDPPAGFLPALLAIYRGPLNHLYAIRGGQCPMYPSCSRYSRQAIARHGPLAGLVITADRLMRCGRDETHLSPRIRIDGQHKTYDPVEANDFWWSLRPAAAAAPAAAPRTANGAIK